VNTSTGIDTREMVAVHSAFRREFAQAPALVSGVPVGDTQRAATVADHLQLVLEMLHHHHDGEDRLLWPKLHARVEAELTPIVELMERQHGGIHAELEQARALLGRWRGAAAETEREQLAASLERLSSLLGEHLVAEEAQLLPLAARCLTQQEWNELGEEGMASIPKRQMPMVFGMIIKDRDPGVIREMISHAPLVPRLLLPRIAPRAYARYARRLHGDAIPA
jgi:hypothetical protein